MLKSITVDYRPEAMSALQATVLSAFEAGNERVVLDLDAIEHLDEAGVRGLITLLRRSREVGGEVALHASRPDITRSLAVMALDRLFPMVDAA
jgi:anti-anti-sigma factor